FAMGFLASLLVVYGVAGVFLAGAVAFAVARALHYRRRSRVADYAQHPWAEIREGFALLRGTVTADGLEAEATSDPVISVEIPMPHESFRGGASRTRVQPFSLRFASGAVVRVEAEESSLVLDTTFVPTTRGADSMYVAQVRPGEEIYLAGAVCRE